MRTAQVSGQCRVKKSTDHTCAQVSGQFQGWKCTEFDSGEISGWAQSITGSHHPSRWRPRPAMLNLDFESKCSCSALLTCHRCVHNEGERNKISVVMSVSWKTACSLHVTLGLSTLLQMFPFFGYTSLYENLFA